MKVIAREKLVHAAEMRGYSIPNLAASLELSASHLYAILRGESTQPKTAKKIAKAVGLQISELFDGKDGQNYG